MTAPLYFLPLRGSELVAQSGRLARGVLARFGLDETLADVETVEQAIVTEVTGAGPTGKSGVILCGLPVGGHAPFKTGYDPRIQDWAPLGAADGAWLGLEKGNPPTPAELARRRQTRGYGIELADGLAWQIPIVRRPDGSTELPRHLGWDAQGRFETRVKEAHRRLWEDAAEVCDWMFEPGATAFQPRERVVTSLDQALDRCVAALALNYRYGRAEQSRLGLIDSTNWASVLAALVDLPLYLALAEWTEKKSTDHTSGETSSAGAESSSPGGREVSPTTGPAGAS